MMKSIRIGLHSLVLTFFDIVGVLAGFAIFKLSGGTDQLLVQVPIAILISVLFFVTWSLLPRILGLTAWMFASVPEVLATFACSLVWNPIVFVPLHYFTQGYVTSIGNIIALALYQLPVNTIALAAAWGVLKWRSRAAGLNKDIVEQKLY